jgi:hypothetical protein
VKTLSRERIRQAFLTNDTDRMELLNALAMFGWGSFLLRGMVRQDPFMLFPSISQMTRIMPLVHWVAFLWVASALQIAGLLYGLRWARGAAAFVSAALLFAIVWAFGNVEPRFPFVSYAFCLAIGQWACLIRMVAGAKVEPLLSMQKDDSVLPPPDTTL